MLPFHTSTGMPIYFSFKPKTATEILSQMELPQSTLIYLVMAQPIKADVPPFVLQVFGTNNSFKAKNMLQRWNHMKSELAK